MSYDTENYDGLVFDAPHPEAERAALSIRRSIASVETSLTEFEKISAGLAALRTEYPIDLVFDVATTKGMAEAIAHRAAWRDPRITVEKFRKAAKAPVLTLGKDIDARAAWLTDQLLLGETPAHEQIKAEEARKAQEKADREAAEFGRVLAIQEAIAEFSMLAMTQHLPSIAIAARLEELRTMVLDKVVYQELIAQAEAARNAAVAKLEVALKAKQWDESQEAERMAAEVNRQAEQAAADAERARVAEAQRIEGDRLVKERAELMEKQAEVVAFMQARAKEKAEADAALVLAAQPKPEPVSELVPVPVLVSASMPTPAAPLAVTMEVPEPGSTLHVLLMHIGIARYGEFPSAPKVGPAWWSKLYDLADGAGGSVS